MLGEGHSGLTEVQPVVEPLPLDYLQETGRVITKNLSRAMAARLSFQRDMSPQTTQPNKASHNRKLARTHSQQFKLRSQRTLPGKDTRYPSHAHARTA
jgi:hypothetical protein